MILEAYKKQKEFLDQERYDEKEDQTIIKELAQKIYQLEKGTK